MKILRNLEDGASSCHGGVVSIGNFDGVHRGHVRLVERLRKLADRRNTVAVVFTFDPHPAAILRQEGPPVPLTTIAQRSRLLGEHGVDIVIAYPTDAALLALTPQDFFAEVVQDRLRASVLVEGPNFRFGRDRSGDVELLKQLACRDSLQIEVVEPFTDNGEVVSSSSIRRALIAGRLEQAARALGRPYSIEGRVIRGAGRGRRLGFPTANLAEIGTLLPGHGVYVARVRIDARWWRGAVNVGPNPTFGENDAKVEVHLIGFDGNLYGQTLRVDLVARLRDTRTFSDAADLTEQLQLDVQTAGAWPIAG